MLLTLLIQTSVQNKVTTINLTAVYIALIGTLVAAVISALASLRASGKITATTREVAKLSNEHAQIIKDKEYKNDYYKKVIDKRMMAVDLVSKILGEFIYTSTVQGFFEKGLYVQSENGVQEIIPPGATTEHSCYLYFHDNVDTLTEKEIMIPLTNEEKANLIWCSEETNKAITDLFNLIIRIVKETNELKLDGANKIIIYSFRHTEVEQQVKILESSLMREMKDLHNIDSFLRDKSINE